MKETSDKQEFEDGWGVTCAKKGKQRQPTSYVWVLFQTCEEADRFKEQLDAKESSWIHKREKGRFCYLPPKPAYPVRIEKEDSPSKKFTKDHPRWSGTPCAKQPTSVIAKVVVKEVDNT